MSAIDGADRTHRLGEIAAATGQPVVRLGAHSDLDEVTSRLAAAQDGGCLVVVDDADRLPDDALDLLTGAARDGTAMVIARRPSLDRPALAALDQVLAAAGSVAELAPLDADGSPL